ncbi:hypothetical protein D3C72_1740360 [compost metagenome]
MAPVMSSETVACTVRSPSATFCNSFIRRRMAAWFCSFLAFATSSFSCDCRRRISASWRRRSASRVRLTESCSSTLPMPAAAIRVSSTPPTIIQKATPRVSWFT